jgi:RNA polymerase sigma-70 factor (ECF subfamily)
MVLLDEAALDALDAELDQRGDEALAARLDALKHCVECLPERSRRLVDLRYHENRDGQQVAETMGLKLDAMYQAMRRVHLALRECVERRLREA